jgi:hypothetical protein
MLVLAWSAVVFGSLLFLGRGILRQNSDQINDFSAPYIGSRLWMEQYDPYDSSIFIRAWNDADGPVLNESSIDPSSIHVVYPPTTFPLLAPIAVFSWRIANKLLVLLTVGFYLLGVSKLLKLIDEGWNGVKKPLFLAFALALAPVQSTLHVSNIAGLTASFLLIGTSILIQDAASLFGPISIALAICLKPTLGIITIPYLVLERRWRALGIISSVVITIIAISMLPLVHEPGWIHSYNKNISVVFTDGGAADVAGQTRFDLLNLEVPFYAISHSREISALFVGIFTVSMLLGWAYLARENMPGRTNALLLVSVLTVVSLLAFYQRYYSGIVLLLPMVWAMQFPFLAIQRWTLVICSCFLVNTEALLRKTKLMDRLHDRFPNATDIVIGPHLSWLLLVLSVLLIGHVYKYDDYWREARSKT